MEPIPGEHSPKPMPPPLPPAEEPEEAIYVAGPPGAWTPTAPRPAISSAAQAARASWIAPIIAAVLGYTLNAAQRDSFSRSAAMVVGIADLLLLTGGLCLALVALAGVKQHGRAGILTPAIVGLCMNGGLLLLGAVLFAIALMLK